MIHRITVPGFRSEAPVIRGRRRRRIAYCVLYLEGEGSRGWSECSESYTSPMKKASVTETKNNLSAILQQVREGETYLILDRGRAVARLEPVGAESRGEDERRADLERRGLLHRGRGRVRKDLVDSPPPQLPKNVSALAIVLEERSEGR